MSWQELGLCAQHPEIDWVPTHEKRGATPLAARANVTAAKAVCAVCPVRDDCLEDALSHWGTAGIWGGTTQTERDRLPRARLRASEATCGTDSGYYHHLRQMKDEPCADCRRAHSESVRRRAWLRRA